MEQGEASRPLPGTIVILVAGSERPLQVVGTVIAGGEGTLKLRIDGPAELEDQRTLLFIHGERGARHVARGAWAGGSGAVASFRISPWQRFDVRGSERYPVNIPAEVRSVLGTSRQDGLMLDVSLGGAAVAVPERPGGKSVELSLSAGGFASRLPCEVVGANEGGDSVLLHLRFAALTPSQQAFVRTLIRSLQTALDLEARAA